LCDVFPMNGFHLLLGRLWQFDRNAIHDGKKNTILLEKGRRRFRLLPMKDDKWDNNIGTSKVMLCLKEEKKAKHYFARLPKDIKSKLKRSDVPSEAKVLLTEFEQVISYELPRGSPHMRSISHQIDLSLGLSLHNKTPYRLTPT